MDMMGNLVIVIIVIDENGVYLFMNLFLGFGYKVIFLLFDGYEFVFVNQGGDDSLDSDVGDMGMLSIFMFVFSFVNLMIDVGFCVFVCNIELGIFM